MRKAGRKERRTAPRSRPSDSLSVSTAWIALLLLHGGCHHVPLANPVRETPPLPEELAGWLRPGHPGESLRIEPLGESSRFTRHRLVFESAGSPPRVVTGEYYRVRSASPSSPAPLLQISPILGGAGDDYLASRVFAGWAAEAGISSFFLHQEETLLAPERGARELEELLRRSTAENIQAIDLLIELPEVDGSRLGSFGISLGAIRNVLLAAAEPRLAGNILCLVGGDFPRILRHSRERMVLEYLEARREKAGMSRDQVIADFRAHLVSDPIEVARYVDPRRVLLFLGSLDDKVPYATGLALRRALGDPELHVFPVGHYTGMVCAPRTAQLGFAWLEARWAETGEAPP